MKFGKGSLINLDDEEGGRTVRTCVARDGKQFLLEINRPVVETDEEAQKAAENCCKIKDGRMITAITLSPEAFYAILTAGCQLAQRIDEAPEETKFTAPETESI